MKIAVVGAGLTGLKAAKELSEYASVVVFEPEDIGGLVASYEGVEKFYHHCFRDDDFLLEEIKRSGLNSKLVWRIAKTGFAANGKIYPLNTPFEILRYPLLTFGEKIRLARFTLKSRKLNYENFDDIGVIEGIRRELGEGLLERFFMPLLRSKFGENAEEVSYAWLLGRVAIRSNRKYSGEEIGYIRHGFQQLVDKMAEGLEIRKERARIRKNAKWEVNGEQFDAVIYTAPLPELGELGEKLGISEIRYQSSVCALVGAEETLTENIYWTNIVDRMSFGAVIEHTNFMLYEDYGIHLIYLASYSTPDGYLFNLSDKEIERLFLSDLKKLGFNTDSIKWMKIFKAKYSGPIYERGYRRKITPYRVADGFYIAGMTSRPNYPERSMNGSVRAGYEVAEQVKKDFL
ncbi:MAG: NAD(P)/FAD-dependent oxidoreductase [Archaeoglobus sp.]|uniref:NAD(P)/FAD-dependent oxidoreductase n=1 Tax=Archaeoglobus sp. TaxID=1872626 RepID=UPI001DE4C409|nr:NAD(P)/FAD-dependent oxidoreductase [Archaeoglobus sp.]MBO8179483.1 NAD(P)/FAD-dependent oxidoreductase [Archaeoglobus sp.]